MGLNWELTKKFKKLEITTGYDEYIKFFFCINKAHGLQVAFFNRLLSVRFK